VRLLTMLYCGLVSTLKSSLASMLVVPETISNVTVTAGFASGGSGGCSLKALTPWFHIKIWEMDRNCLLYIYNYI